MKFLKSDTFYININVKYFLKKTKIKNNELNFLFFKLCFEKLCVIFAAILFEIQ